MRDLFSGSNDSERRLLVWYEQMIHWSGSWPILTVFPGYNCRTMVHNSTHAGKLNVSVAFVQS